MPIREYTIVSAEGMHARPASILTKTAGKYEDEITLHHEDKSVTLKSIMAVMSLGIPGGDTFKIEVEGDNAETIYQDLETILKEHKIIE